MRLLLLRLYRESHEIQVKTRDMLETCQKALNYNFEMSSNYNYDNNKKNNNNNSDDEDEDNDEQQQQQDSISDLDADESVAMIEGDNIIEDIE